VNELLESHFQEPLNEGLEEVIVFRVSWSDGNQPARLILIKAPVSGSMHKADSLAEIAVDVDLIMKKS
jgi:hypothetical protein